MKRKQWVNILKVALFLAIGLIILYLVYEKQNAAYQEQCAIDGIPADECNLIKKVFRDFSSINLWWIAAVWLAFMLSNLSRALRWNQLLQPLGFHTKTYNSFFSIMLGYFANLGFPRVGEVVRGGALARYEGIPLAKVMGTIVVDRVVDVLCLAGVFLLAFAIEFDVLYSYISQAVSGKSESASGLSWQYIAGGILIALVFGLYLFRNQIRKLGIWMKLVEIWKSFVEGLQTVRRLRHPGVFVLHSIFIWLMYYLMTYLSFFAFEPTSGLSPVVALMVFVFGTLGIVIPSPGGMGTYHYLTVVALSIYGVTGGDGFSFANILFFSVQIFCNVSFGILALILLPLLNKGRLDEIAIPTSSIEEQ